MIKVPLYNPGARDLRKARLGMGTLLLFAVQLALAGCDPKLQRITVSALQTQVAKGTDVQLVASGSYSDGTDRDITSEVTWTSRDGTLATVANGAGRSGQVHAAARGQALIGASLGDVAGSATVDITDAVLTGVAVAPQVAAIAKGTTQRFTATGTFSDGTTQDLTASASWTADTAVATLSGSASGLLSALGSARGATLVTATVLGRSGAASLIISDATLTALAITPPELTLAKGTTALLTATGAFSDGTSQDLTSLVAWTTGDVAIAVLSSSSGLAYGRIRSLAKGQTTLTATFGGKSATSAITVTDASLVSLSVTPPAPVLPKGTALLLTVTGTFSDDTTQDLTSSAQWTSSQDAVATVSVLAGSAGRVSAHAPGGATLTAAFGGKSAVSVLTVTDAALSVILVSADNALLAKGVTGQLTATGLFSDDTLQDLTSLVTWSSDDSNIAVVSNLSGQRGRLSSLNKGVTMARATLGAKSGALAITVSDASLVSLAVSAMGALIAKGTTAQFTAVGTYSDGTTTDLTTQAGWATLDASIAAVSQAPGSQGLATALGVGATLVTATFGGKGGSATLSVSDAVLTGITIDPQGPTLLAGGALMLIATGSYSDNTKQDISSLVTWSSGDNLIASVSNAGGSRGLATAANNGTVLLSASLSGLSATTSLTVGLPLQAGALALSAAGSSSINADFTAASGGSGVLSYAVYQRTDSFSAATVAAVVAEGTLVDAAASPGALVISGLMAGQAYSVAVIVTDMAGANALYPLQMLTTSPASKVMFLATTISGNMGGIAGADTLCQVNRPAGMVSNTKAMITEGKLRVACTTANCGGGTLEHTDWVLSPNTPYSRPTGEAIGTTNTAGIFTFPLANGVGLSGLVSFTGFNLDWTSSSDNCSGWTSTATVAAGGNPNTTDASTLFYGKMGCSSFSQPIYCVEQ